MPLLEDLYAKQRARELELDHFIYTSIFGSVAAGATVPNNTSIQADSDFVIRYVNITAHPAGPVVSTVVPELLISLFDSGSGRNLQDAPVHIANICGGMPNVGGILPGILPEPKLISGSAVLTTTLQNIGTVAFVRVDVAFIGEKVFYFRRFQR
jgi:hypothetical protein